MKRLLPFVLTAAALLAWELVARSGRWSPLLFPPLERILNELILFFSKSESLMEASGLSPLKPRTRRLRGWRRPPGGRVSAC